MAGGLAVIPEHNICKLVDSKVNTLYLLFQNKPAVE